jgi:hypothetical protein
MLTLTCSRQDARTINDAIDGYGPAFRGWLGSNHTRIVVLKAGQRYADVSLIVRREHAVDHWACPPAGLFVPYEGTVYLRSLSPMVIAHEVVHAYDWARGAGRYVSHSDPTVRRLFREARAYVTPYAASGVDEYFAECGRALHPNGNDPLSPWPDATPARLQQIDPAMYDYVTGLFAEYPAQVQAA